LLLTATRWWRGLRPRVLLKCPQHKQTFADYRVTLTFYLLLLGFLLTHELDAVACREWRLLYVLRVLPEATARTAFIALHVPLIAALAWTTAAAHPAAANARLAVAAFALVHAALHYRLRRAPAYEFHAPLSIALIAGAALCGAAYLVVALRA